MVAPSSECTRKYHAVSVDEYCAWAVESGKRCYVIDTWAWASPTIQNSSILVNVIGTESDIRPLRASSSTHHYVSMLCDCSLIAGILLGLLHATIVDPSFVKT